MAASAVNESQPAAPSTFHAATEMPGIWKADTSTFPEELAPGTEWPANPPGNMADEGVVNEDGLAGITASFYWLCTWEHAYLEAVDTNDSAGQRTALAEIDKFTGLPAVKDHYPDVDLWKTAVVDPVEAGEGPKTLEQDYRIGTCSGFIEQIEGER
ncbi:hypothetical protein N1031_07345 [Herbiconiux moechotypicola]|uniref:Uncharacterized protein n=1 Tax=Herbiconiux moechotypicola TaxID=637393 RepID=A0ABN3DH83_9MICO|nr:hypothetical protein [Herbiconiux moechotypicola]MCS5729572.1 hypothetical protein [Herbiconiux moechotypicola]